MAVHLAQDRCNRVPIIETGLVKYFIHYLYLPKLVDLNN